jgi:hypothetical protein
VSAQSRTTVCGQAEYAAMLRRSPPTVERLQFPIPPGAQISVQQTPNEGWPRRGFSQRTIYRFPPGTKVADVERFFVRAGMYEVKGTLLRDVLPNKRPGNSTRKVTEVEEVVTYSTYRNTIPAKGTPWGDVAWVAEQLRDHPPTAADLTAPLFPGAVLDIDFSTAGISLETGAVIGYYTSASLEEERALYGIPANAWVRKISPDSRIHQLSVAAYSKTGPKKRTRFWIELPNPGPVAHLTGAGPIGAGPPPGWDGSPAAGKGDANESRSRPYSSRRPERVLRCLPGDFNRIRGSLWHANNGAHQMIATFQASLS